MPPHPFHPVIVRAVAKFAAGRRQVAGEGLVGPEHEVQRPGEHERPLLVDQRHRRVGGQADEARFVGVADVIAAERAPRHRLAVIAGRPHPDGDARQTGDGLDDTEKLRRTEDAAELAEARREVGDPHFAAVAVGEDMADDRGIADVFGPELRHVVEHDVGEALFLRPRDQPAKIGSPSKRG